MYSVQYSATYNDRYDKLSPGLIDLGRREGFEYSTYLKEGQIFLVGVLEIKYEKKKILPKYSSAVREITYSKIVHETIFTSPEKDRKRECFLESPTLERVKIFDGMDETIFNEYFVDGAVVGILGERNEENHFIARKIFYPGDVLEEKSRKNIKITILGNDSIVEKTEKKKNTDLIICSDYRILPKSIPSGECLLLLNTPQRDNRVNLKNTVYAVPDVSEYPSYMLPWISSNSPIHNELQTRGIEESLASPSVRMIGGITVGIVNIKSVQCIIGHHRLEESVDGYITALRAIIMNRHLSPLSPLTCPSIPSKVDEFVIKTIPDVLVVKCPFNSIQKIEVGGVAVDILLMKDISVLIEKKR